MKSTLNIYWKDWGWSWSSNTLASWCEEPTHWKRPWCWERLKAGETTEDEMVGWHHWLNGCEFEQTLGDGEGQGSLVCCNDWATEQQGVMWQTAQPFSLFWLHGFKERQWIQNLNFILNQTVVWKKDPGCIQGLVPSHIFTEPKVCLRRQVKKKKKTGEAGWNGMPGNCLLLGKKQRNKGNLSKKVMQIVKYLFGTSEKHCSRCLAIWIVYGKITWRRAWQPSPVFLLGESPWTKETSIHGVADTAERLGTHTAKTD